MERKQQSMYLYLISSQMSCSELCIFEKDRDEVRERSQVILVAHVSLKLTSAAAVGAPVQGRGATGCDRGRAGSIHVPVLSEREIASSNARAMTLLGMGDKCERKIAQTLTTLHGWQRVEQEQEEVMGRAWRLVGISAGVLIGEKVGRSRVEWEGSRRRALVVVVVQVGRRTRVGKERKTPAGT
ncbi:hypothetical protein AXG93_392s1320 [Marchantia polymorpha subsp. ruderalis]|uniref:Uncharacterized protein n=1 Tax=Marchantia polymorpha subsp. ruderalis TaxID=1480154 RepID=A0A176WRW1_MARPO|nr:hypothetical protein AXG93_392s1320 [Marchantia polymorpha subsp. ruderalis]